MNDNETRVAAIAKYCDIRPDEVEEVGDNLFIADDQEYLILTEMEAYERAGEQVRETVGYFEPWFIADHVATDSDIEDIEAIQQQCSDVNGIITRLINDMDEFIDDAIYNDGIGHFIAEDLEEIELTNELCAYAQ